MWNPFARAKASVSDSPPASAPAADAADGGLQNLAAGLNSDRDKRWYSTYLSPDTQDPQTIENMVRTSWLAGRLVNTIAEDMTRAGWSLSWDEREKDSDDARRLADLEAAVGLRAKINDGITWGRQFGGAGVLIGIRGQEDLSKPLVLDSVKENSLAYLHAFDRWDVFPVAGVTELNLESPFALEPVHYTIANAETNVPLVHRSRLVLFDGRRVSRRAWRQNGFWHDSVLLSAIESVKNYDTATGGVASMIFEANVDIMTIPGLAELVTTDKGRAKLLERFTTTAMMKSFNRMLLMDGGKVGDAAAKPETFSQKTTQFAGVNEAILRFMADVAGAADCPVTRLFGQSPGGLNATGDSDLRNYYDHVNARQNTSLRPQLSYLYEILTRSAFGSKPKNFEITFNPLWQTSDKERAEINNIQMETDTGYITAGVLSTVAIAKEVMERGYYVTMEADDVKLAQEMQEHAAELEEAEAENAAAAAKAKAAPAVPAAGKGAGPAEPEEPAAE